jgi:hypothetical protein
VEPHNGATTVSRWWEEIEEAPVSEMSQGPGWWIASDGKWYPPESHPDVVASRGSTTSPAGTASPASTAEPGGASVLSPSSPGRGRRSFVPWAVGAVVLVALAVAAVVVALVSGGGSSAFAPGAETATIHVTVPRSGSPSFSGTVGDSTLTGKVSDGTSSPTGTGSTTSSSGGVLFTYEGTLSGSPYALRVSLDSGNNGPLLEGGLVTFEVTGTYGSEQVTGNAEFGVASSTGRSLTVPFTGRVGSQVVVGTANVTQDGDGTFEVTAKLNVSGTL